MISASDRKTAVDLIEEVLLRVSVYVGYYLFKRTT